jgi:hypothetical protein
METRVGANFSVRDVVAADCVIMAQEAVDALQREWT